MTHRELFRVEALPVFQNKMFPDRAAAMACPRGDVVLVQDMETGLIFNSAFEPEALKYDASYQNEQACSALFKQHLANVKSIIDRHLAGREIIELGCGKGYFLDYLQKAGYKIIGVDPAYEGDNTRIIKGRFQANQGLSADGIVLRHVLEHMSDPLSFLAEVALANGNKGQVYIEVPCFDWICQHRTWFDVFYEHANYFRLADFHRIFGDVYESGRVFGGQYLYVVADLATLRQPVIDKSDDFTFPADFLSDITRVPSLTRGKRKVIWGGASKGVIFALYMQRAGVDLDMVIDINPAKQGKYMAGSGLLITSPEEGAQTLQAGDDIFIMNSNYLQEIIAMTDGKYNYIQADLPAQHTTNRTPEPIR